MTCNCWRGLWSSPYHISEIFNNIFQPLFDILTSCKKYCDFFFLELIINTSNTIHIYIILK